LIIKNGGHDDQLSRQFWGMDRFRIRALNKLLNNAKLDDVDRNAATNTLQHKLGILLQGARKHGNQAVVDEFSALCEPFLQAG